MSTIRMDEPVRAPRHDDSLEGKLAATGWGLFLVWLGILFIAGMGFGVGMLGIGLITLGMQGARKALGLPVERFWVIAGGLFLLMAIWGALDTRIPLIGVLLFIVGALILSRALRSS
jgi:hypothetical protein